MREQRPCYASARDTSVSPQVGGWKGGISHVSRSFPFATRKASFRYGGRDNASCPFLGKGLRKLRRREVEKDKVWISIENSIFNHIRLCLKFYIFCLISLRPREKSMRSCGRIYLAETSGCNFFYRTISRKWLRLDATQGYNLNHRYLLFIHVNRNSDKLTDIYVASNTSTRGLPFTNIAHRINEACRRKTTMSWTPPNRSKTTQIRTWSLTFKNSILSLGQAQLPRGEARHKENEEAASYP